MLARFLGIAAADEAFRDYAKAHGRRWPDDGLQADAELVHYVEASAVLQRHLHDLVLGAASPGRAMADAQAELLALQARFSS